MDIEKMIRSVEDMYDFPTDLQVRSYREPSRNQDVTQVSFRYHPDPRATNEKFAFEMAAPDRKNPSDKRLRLISDELHRHLESMEEMWKQHFNFIYWKDVPFTSDFNDGDFFRLKCELCQETKTIDQPEDVHTRRDLYLLYLLKQFDHDCHNRKT